MVPPATMLATKNRCGYCATLCVALAVIAAGCTPAGPRALLDGKELLEEGKFSQAAERLRVATSLLNTNAQAWNYLGLAYHRAAQPTNAVAAYQKALDLNRDLLEARFNLGCLWLDSNRPELARAELTAYTLRRGNAIEGWLKLGAAQLRTREPAAAEKSFREALRINQNSAEALNGMGLAQVQRNRPRDAIQYFNTALQRQPDYQPALLNLAVVAHQHLHDRTAALKWYRDYLALKPRPSNWNAVNAVAQALESQLSPPPHPPATNTVVPPTVAATNLTRSAAGSVAQAPQTRNDVTTKKLESPPPVKTEPQTPVAKPVASAPPPQAPAVEIVTLPPEPVIRTAADTAPGNATATATAPSTPDADAPPAQSDQPQVDTHTNTIAAASQNVLAASGARYTYLSPAKPSGGNRREAERAFAQGQQAQRSNRLGEALQAYRQATQADPSYFEAHYNLGLVAYESRNYRVSLAAWETALAIQPESADARYNFALALKAANHPLDAANELKQVLAANANETRAHLVLGNLYAEQFGNPAQARAHYLKVLEQDPRHPQATAIRYWLVANPP